jgi:CheY-like chemotaxis protein
MEWGRSSEGGGEPDGVSGGEPDGVSGGGCGRVLVCDDTEQIRRLIRVNLELDGYEVVEAEDGPAALEILQDVTRPLPDVITVDVVMPRRDGWWMVSMIRADPRLAHIPIVMVTASAQFQDRRQAEEATVDEFVAKPFDPEELLAKIEALVGDHRV